ncbi:hypothetical protein ACOBQX_18770 [Actinokineospora sp. G85]|uniref:hypothetical protein n=1 Tax=Actinokineospora sp. G85 TaxID=3406626 RepID=UPI003C71FDDF
MAKSPVPPDVRDTVIRELYRRVQKLDWDEMTAQEKSACYAEWVGDPGIGFALADYQTAEGMRVWLKDGPLKEYARALEGVGQYARYTSKRLTPPSEFIPTVLGPGWAPVSRSVGEKPMHCTASDGTSERYVCWGKPGTFRDLLWAGVNKAIDSPATPLAIVTTREDGKQISEQDRNWFLRLGEHCGIEVAFVTRRLEDVLLG